MRTDTYGNTNKPQNITSSEMSLTQKDIYDSTFKKYLESTKKEHRIHLQGLKERESREFMLNRKRASICRVVTKVSQ